jgi:hypothetical protein
MRRRHGKILQKQAGSNLNKSAHISSRNLVHIETQHTVQSFESSLRSVQAYYFMVTVICAEGEGKYYLSKPDQM